MEKSRKGRFYATLRDFLILRGFAGFAKTVRNIERLFKNAENISIFGKVCNPNATMQPNATRKSARKRAALRVFLFIVQPKEKPRHAGGAFINQTC